MTSLCLSQYNYNMQRLELVDSYVSDALLYSRNISSSPKVMLKCPATDMYKTECMMRGLELNIKEVEPGKPIQLWGHCYILHKSDEFPDFNDDHEVWICSPTG
ncbi:MAG: hypothetical protein [Caudoviricetes sp.]|nr:MAG: hypothetical protein [Caudoviricetes sp.]